MIIIVISTIIVIIFYSDIVQAAHLKPLERKDKVGLDFKQPWNSAVNDTKSEIPHLNQKLPVIDLFSYIKSVIHA